MTFKVHMAIAAPMSVQYLNLTLKAETHDVWQSLKFLGNFPTVNLALEGLRGVTNNLYFQDGYYIGYYAGNDKIIYKFRLFNVVTMLSVKFLSPWEIGLNVR